MAREWEMGVETVSLVISAFVHASMAIAALLRNFRSRLCISFSVMTGLFFAHDALSVFGHFKGTEPFVTAEIFAVFALAPATVWFVWEVLALPRERAKPWAWTYGIAAAALGLVFFLPFFSRISPFLLLAVHLFYLIPAGLWMVEVRRAQHVCPLTRERLRLRYAYFGGVFTFAFFLTDVMYLAGWSVPPLGTLARTLYLFFLFHTFIQKELMTAEEVFAKIALFGGVALMLSTIFSFLVSWVGDQWDLFYFNTLIASVVIIVLFDPIRGFTYRLTRRFFLRRNAAMETQLADLVDQLRGVVEPAEISRRLSAGLGVSVEAERAQLFVRDREGLSFIPFGRDGYPDHLALLPSGNPLGEYMTLRRGRPFVQETLESDYESFHSRQAREFCQLCLDELRVLGADLILPFVHEGSVVGFGAVKTGERLVLSNEQLRLFIPLCRQVALQLRNAQALQALRERDKMAAVGEMAAGLAHEIRNPLGSIKGAAQLLKEEIQEAGGEYLSIIQDETDRLSGVLSDFLDYAKPRRLDPRTRCRPAAVVEHVAALILKDSDVRVEIEGDETGLEMEGDPDLLKQVLLNLMLNGVQAMESEPNPVLRVRIREVKPHRTWPFSAELPRYKKWEGWQNPEELATSSYVEIDVMDNGVGVVPEEAERIFVPFYTSKPQGTGLGLAICQRLVENMGGTLTVRPNQPKGSVFSIHLPSGGDSSWTPPAGRPLLGDRKRNGIQLNNSQGGTHE